MEKLNERKDTMCQVTTENECKVYFKHFEVEKRNITLAIAIIYSFKGLAALNIGYAVCMPEDTFDKTVGEKTAIGRAVKPRKRTIWKSSLVNSDLTDLFDKRIMNILLNNAFKEFKKTKLKEIEKR